MTEKRHDGRAPNELRNVVIRPDYIKHAEGAVLVEMGDTKVICTASVEERVPQFLQKTGKGWVTAEYGMLPRATTERTQREASRGKQGGRTMEIQRLVGRSLRAAVDPELLGERTVWIDCDVIQADGGTRCASITGGFVALTLALGKMFTAKKLASWPVTNFVSAVSVGVVDAVPCLDLDYKEDSSADVDMNVVGTEKGHFIEVQGTAEGKTFSRDEMDGMLDLARAGMNELFLKQHMILDELIGEIDKMVLDRLNKKFGKK